MKTRIIRIGSSQGEVHEGRIVIREASQPREGWAAAFQAMAESGDDDLPDPEVASEWDQKEWEW